MNNKSLPTNNGVGLEEFITSFTEEEYEFPKLNPGNTPIFHAVILFLDGFNKAFYEGECR